MTQSMTLAFDGPTEKGLSQYIQNVNQLPMLTAEEEHDLATRLQNDGDLDAARTMVMSHLRYVVRVAKGYKGYGLPLADLIQEGNIGLMKAVKAFDPERGVRLVSFAGHWIRAEIYDFVLRNWRIVKVATTKSQRKLFFNLRKAKKTLSWLTDAETENLATKLDVKKETVTEMESRLYGRDLGFDGAQDDEEHPISPAGYLPDMRYNPEALVTASDNANNREGLLVQAMGDLDARSRDIIQRRWLSEDKATLQELAGEYSISAERIRQIEKKAMGKMKNHLAA